MLFQTATQEEPNISSCSSETLLVRCINKPQGLDGEGNRSCFFHQGLWEEELLSADIWHAVLSTSEIHLIKYLIMFCNIACTRCGSRKCTGRLCIKLHSSGFTVLRLKIIWLVSVLLMKGIYYDIPNICSITDCNKIIQQSVISICNYLIILLYYFESWKHLLMLVIRIKTHRDTYNSSLYIINNHIPMQSWLKMNWKMALIFLNVINVLECTRENFHLKAIC